MIININDFSLDEIARKAVETIRAGKIVVVPFDTVYGFVANPRDERAISDLNQLKGRPETKTIGTAVSSVVDLLEITDGCEKFIEFVKSKTPGPFTFICKDNPQNGISKLCKRDNNIGVRIPDNSLILKIAKLSGGVIAQTSANKSGQPNCYSLDELFKQYDRPFIENKSAVGLVIDGGVLPANPPSQLWDLTGNTPSKIERN